jgi:Protein of unknown function (DUF3891)
MIRRELKLSGDAVTWLLIAQVEHAHLSGELVRHWRDTFSPDVVEAIWHHDDGWAEWETSPKLNPQTGAPYSFLEMPITESLVIWDNSIAAARKFGPLAGWIVAGHFYNLLADSEHANDPPAIAWLTAKRKVRTAWLDEWIRADKSHTLEYAKRAQEMLLTADLFSLWLCCDCPIDAGEGKSSGQLEKSAMKLRADKLHAALHFDSPECTIRESISKSRIEGLSWIVPVKPYPFGVEPLSLQASATMVPAARYRSWQEIMAASWPVDLSCRLLSAVGG